MFRVLVLCFLFSTSSFAEEDSDNVASLKHDLIVVSPLDPHNTEVNSQLLNSLAGKNGVIFSSGFSSEAVSCPTGQTKIRCSTTGYWNCCSDGGYCDDGIPVCN